MTNFFLAILAAVLCTVHLRVPFALLQKVQKTQADFDSQLFSRDSCRSNFENSNTRLFRFSMQEELPCFFERIDFGTVETKGHWPKSVCIILTHVHGKSHPSGAETCSYL
jgi:hypothetical protein